MLIEGESGSGKELIAAALHRQSPRAAKPFLALNCAAISPNLVEPTLFGYSKGAFTGATTSRAGYFEDAKDSTLFLDEIGELPLELQAKLLRVLENGEFQRVGETQNRVSNARVIAATNRDMRQEIRNGRFRADLYHRLSVFTIAVPSLRDLGDDKRLLLDQFRDFYARQAAVAPFELDAKAMQLWLDYGFPGNVRELRNIVIRLTTKCAGQTVNAEQLEAELDMESMQLDCAGTAARPGFQIGARGGQETFADRKGFQPRSHAATMGKGLRRSGAGDHPRQPVAGGQAARHSSHHALQPHAELRRAGRGARRAGVSRRCRARDEGRRSARRGFPIARGR